MDDEDPEVPTMDDIPEGLIEYIMMNLSPYGDLQSCRLVSRQWNRIAKGAIIRLNRLFNRCQNLEWFLLQLPEVSKFPSIGERCSHSACYHQTTNSIFVFGGCTVSYTTFNDLWRFDLSNRLWIRPYPVSGSYPSPKACSSLVEYKGKLFLYGGWSKNSPNPIHQTAVFFNEFHCYDPEASSWSIVKSSNCPPHLAGHSATVLKDMMIVFGGSTGSGSNNQIWLFNFTTNEWSQPAPLSDEQNSLPLPRYGQSQCLLDSEHLLIVGGCGGPNMIYNDVWVLTIPKTKGSPWFWREITVANVRLAAPQLWSHPACKLDHKIVVFGKPPQCFRDMSCSPRSSVEDFNERRAHEVAQLRQRARVTPFGPPQNNLIPPRRKLITSRSLDEQDPEPGTDTKPGTSAGSSTFDHRLAELQRAKSIPAIIVGEIPRLVVTEDDNAASSGENSASSSSGSESRPRSSAADRQRARQPPIAMIASSLIPNQAVRVDPADHVLPENYQPRPPGDCQNNSRRSAKGKYRKDRRKYQLEMLHKMEDYIRSRSDAKEMREHAAESTSSSASSSPKIRFRPSSPPPPRSKRSQARNTVACMSKNPMAMYVLDLSRVLSHGEASWHVLENSFMDAPEDTILYSLTKGRAELVLFGGLRNSNSVTQRRQGLDVGPPSSTHSITNETYIIKPSLFSSLA